MPKDKIVLISIQKEDALRYYFKVYYSDNEQKKRYFGEIVVLSEFGRPRIQRRGKDSYINLNSFVTIGMSLDYYYNIYKYFLSKAENILESLNDISILRDLDRFTIERFSENEDINNHYIDRIIYECRLLGQDVGNLTSNKKEPPKFSIEYNGSEIDFDYSVMDSSLSRVILLVGKNGVGKTRILKEITKQVIKDGNLKGFFRVIGVSFNIFDKNEYPFDSYNYRGCGIIATSDPFRSTPSFGISIQRTNKILNRIRYLDREEILFSALSKYYEDFPELSDLISIFYVNRSEVLHYVRNRMSAGQLHMFLMILELIGNISPYSLVLIDEPEIMAHPSMINNIMRFYYYILEKFDSYAIISTHSPQIVQNVPAEYVKIVSKFDGLMNIRSPREETFASDINSITADIFGIDPGGEYYIEKIREISRIKGKQEFTNSLKKLSMFSEMIIDDVYEEEYND